MHTATAIDNDVIWQPLCRKADLVAFSGVAAWLETASGTAQVALFYLPGYETELFAVDNRDPFSGANVIARGIVGDLKGEPVVASPAKGAAVDAADDDLDLAALGADLEHGGELDLKAISKRASQIAEKKVIERVLAQTRWNRKEAAERLQISYKALLYKMKENGLSEGR